MSRFYGVVAGSAKTKATRRGHQGLTVTAASWAGAIEVRVYLAKDGVERFEVLQKPWHGSGVTEVLADGVIGLRSNQPIKIAAE